MSRCKTLMEPFTLLCVSLLTLCLFFLLYSPLLFSCHFLLPFPLALPFCLCFFFSHTPPSILHSCFLVKFQKVSLLLSKPCAVIAFLFQLFINTVPLKIKSMLVTESALLWCLSLFWLTPQKSLLCESSRTKLGLPSPPLGRICFPGCFHKQTYS